MTPIQRSNILGEVAVLLAPGVAKGGYARSSSNQPVGLHCTHRALLDLPGAIWVAAEKHTNAHHEAAFLELWRELRERTGWNTRSDPSSPALCRWLDGRAHQVILSIVAEWAGLETPKAERKTSAKAGQSVDLKRIKIEYA
jgi:hypothetical protein